MFSEYAARLILPAGVSLLSSQNDAPEHAVIVPQDEPLDESEEVNAERPILSESDLVESFPSQAYPT
jgi:hypothetical protein